MPNWVKNVVYVRGDSGNFFERVSKLGVKNVGLFNEFVPRPACYDYDTTNYTLDQSKRPGNLLKVGIKIGDFHTETVSEEYIEQFKAAEEEQKKIGPIGWYAWDCQNWGTKWDIDLDELDYSKSDGSLGFETAWCYPDAFFKRLSKLYPKARFYVFYANEDPSDCGGTVWHNGEHDDTPASELFAEMLWDGGDLSRYVAEREANFIWEESRGSEQ